MTTAVLVLAAVVFLCTAFVLTAAETGLTYLPRADAETIVREDPGSAAAKLLATPTAHLHALRFWTVWFETASAVAVALAMFHGLGDVWLAGLLATVVMAAVGFVLTGVSPRQVGRSNPAGTVRFTSGLVRVLRALLGPVPGLLVRLGSSVARAPGHAAPGFLTEEELLEFVDRSTDQDVIEDNEAELLHSVFDLDDTNVRAVMVPRTDMVTIDDDETVDNALNLFFRSGYSRIPVIGESADDVLGILYQKDLAERVHRQGADLRIGGLSELAREVRYVPESKKVNELLREMQLESIHVAVVVDEYGGTAGLVTLEDLIEELLGEIVDEYDREKPEVAELGDGRYRVSAALGVEDLGDLFGVDLEDDEVDTAGGLLAKSIGRVPIVGSRATVEGIVLEAVTLEGRRNRVGQLEVHRDPEWVPPGSTAVDPAALESEEESHHHV
ncbi:hemolysin family protein [Kocuria turfanensis]|uniref:Membrane protein n=1 Tax=Kocuria turfanensis TaxID=388357 RepID=A0A512ICV4_9MICC|nr:hemolysin family protein [Kocuria turfanensis]GEO95522.1 membrane protein [Kocuria turfanensis]